MRFKREIVLNTPEDCEWLRTTHLRGKPYPEFESFVLAGNEDSPARVDLYTSRKPEYNEQPVVIFEQGDDGELTSPYRPAGKVIRRTRAH